MGNTEGDTQDRWCEARSSHTNKTRFEVTSVPCGQKVPFSKILTWEPKIEKVGGSMPTFHYAHFPFL